MINDFWVVETERRIKVMQAWLDGKQILMVHRDPKFIKYDEKGNEVWVEVSHPYFNWYVEDYRIKE